MNDIYVKKLGIPSGELININNDNNAFVYCSKSSTTKSLHHIIIHKNVSRESVQDKKVSVHRMAGNTNLANIFTKDIKDISDFITMHDVITSITPKFLHNKKCSS